MRERRHEPRPQVPEPDVERAILSLVQELSTKHDISLPVDDPLLVMPRMNAIMGQQLVGLLEEARGRADRELFQQLEGFIDGVRDSFAQDAKQLSMALGNKAKRLSALLGHEIEGKLADMLESHQCEVSRDVGDLLAYYDRRMQWYVVGFSFGVLLAICACVWRITPPDCPDPVPHSDTKRSRSTRAATRGPRRRPCT